MIRKLKWLSSALFIICAVFTASLYGQPKPLPTPAASPTPAPTTFATLLDRAKRGDATLDFQALRMAYTDTPEYSPYGSDRDSRQKMFAALSANEYPNALEFAQTILAKNFLDLNGHFGAFISHRELGHTDDAARHKFLFEGLIHSIENSGDGKAPATAFVVISTDEEYVLLNWRGLRAAGQALINQDGHSYDRMTAVNSKTNETVTYFFNIDKPFNWLSKSLK